MTDYAQQMHDLEQDVLGWMKRDGQQRKALPAKVYMESLKKIRVARQSEDIADVYQAYQAWLTLSQQLEGEANDIEVFLDEISWYTVRFLSDKFLAKGERLIAGLIPVDLGDPFIQHYVQKWQLQPCFMPKHPHFWSTWQRAHDLCVQYRATQAEARIERFLLVYQVPIAGGELVTG